MEENINFNPPINSKMGLKLEERQYLFKIKEQSGKSKELIKLELERDEHYQEILRKSKSKKKQEVKKEKEEAKELNLNFKKDFSLLK